MGGSKGEISAEEGAQELLYYVNTLPFGKFPETNGKFFMQRKVVDFWIFYNYSIIHLK